MSLPVPHMNPFDCRIEPMRAIISPIFPNKPVCELMAYKAYQVMGIGEVYLFVENLCNQLQFTTASIDGWRK